MTRVGPWERRTRRTAYENDWIEIWHDEVTRPDGSHGIYGVVHRSAVTAAIVAVDDSGDVLLVGQHRYPTDRYSWEIVMGDVPLGEDPLSGAQRELAEETGYVASTWRELGHCGVLNAFTDQVCVIFLATGLTAGKPHPDEGEELAVAAVPFDEALAMVDRGEIHDAVSQLGLLAAARVDRV